MPECRQNAAAERGMNRDREREREGREWAKARDSSGDLGPTDRWQSPYSQIRNAGTTDRVRNNTTNPWHFLNDGQNPRHSPLWSSVQLSSESQSLPLVYCLSSFATHLLITWRLAAGQRGQRESCNWLQQFQVSLCLLFAVRFDPAASGVPDFYLWPTLQWDEYQNKTSQQAIPGQCSLLEL